MKLTKVAFAIASVLAISAGSANAGQIDSSSSTLAIEVIKSDAQVVRAPSKTYNFVGDINATTNEQRLQLQYTLAKGTWATGGTNLLSSTLVDVSGLGTLNVNYTDALNAGVSGFPAGSVVNAFLTADAKTMVFNITIPAGAGNLLRQPSITVNPNALGAGNVGMQGLFTVAGVTACVAPDQQLDINFKHFTNHTGNNTLQTVASPDSEHVRQGSTNDARLLNFTQNLDFTFTPAAQSSRTDATSMNSTLVAANYSLALQAGLAFTGKQHHLGSVALRQRSNGLDLNYTNTYGDSVAPFVAAAPFIAADFSYPAAAGATVATGVVELADATVAVTVPTAWPVGTTLTARDAAGAAVAGIADVLTVAGQTSITLKATTAAAAAALANGVNVFAIFPAGNILIPQSGGIPTAATLVKAPAAPAGSDVSEQNNSCSGTLTGIGGGIKIDVRNYATAASFPDGSVFSLVRLINNSETQSADVYGQMIYADGAYGAWGKLADLKPREVLNMTSKQVEANLTNAAAASNPFGGAATQYTAKGGTSVVGSTKAGMGDRLRIVSNTGSTLRVQSYIVQGAMVLDTSNAQGVDFENVGDRVPTNGRDAQPISQDAINGIGK